MLFLVKNAGRVVERDDLLDAVWNDTFIEEGTLTQNISRLRKKLETAGSDEKIIETLPKRGYRFLPQVTPKFEDESRIITTKQPGLSIGIENAILVLEEQTIQQISVRESITFETDDNSETKSKIVSRLPGLRSGIKNYRLLAFCTAASLLLLAGYLTFYRQSDPKIILVSRVIPFSGLAGREDMPSFSPDGRFIAFVWNKEDGNDTDVYVRMIDAGEPLRLTHSEADEVSPVFSPDGKWIAFTRVLPNRSEILLIPALGGPERKICAIRRTSSSISFSPDGLFLAVSDTDERGKAPGVFLVNLENGEKRRITSPPELTSDDRPSFSPDGRSIAFTRGFSPIVQELFVLTVAGGDTTARQITFDKAWVGGVSWTADSAKLIFSSLRKYNSQINLWQLPVDGGTPEIIAVGGRGIGNLAVSPDGRAIAYVEKSSSTSIWRIEPARLPDRTAFQRFAASRGHNNSPNVSPDGTRVVFASSRTGNYEIWIADPAGGNARQLTDLKNSPAGSPRFSPDSKQIAFDAQIDGNGDIFVISSEGGAARRVTDHPSFDFMPSWSSDGNWLYFASDRNKPAQIYKIPVTGGEAVKITQNGGRESYESPDGKQLYYQKGENIAGLWRFSAETNDEQPVAELAAAGYWRYWTVTPAGIYFVARSENPPFKIMFYDFMTHRTREIVETNDSPVWVYPGLGTMPNGNFLYYAQSEQNASNIMLAELKR